MTLTKEWLQQTIEEMEYDKATFPGDLNEDHGNVLEAMKMALAGMEAERPDPQMLFKPVADAYKISHPDESSSFCFSEKADTAIKAIKNGYEVQEYVKLERLQEAFTAPQPLTTSERAELENYRKAQQVVPDIRPDWQENEFSAGWNACRAAMLQGAEPVSNRDELPEVVLHMCQAMSVFEALKKEVLYENVRHAELGAMGAVNVQVWTSVLGGTLQYETSNGGCTLRVIPDVQPADESEINAVDGSYVGAGSGWVTWDELEKRNYLGHRTAILATGILSDFCSKHPQTKRVVHPFMRTASMPSRPIYYCPECDPDVADWEAKWGHK